MVKQKIVKKIIIIAFLFFVVFLINSVPIFAKIDTNKFEIGTELQNTLQEPGSIIFGIVQVVGTIVSVAALIIIGIRYMLGSVEEKAEYKKTLPYYIIGATLVFATSNLVQYFYDAITGIN